jgi:hypothetical protein
MKPAARRPASKPPEAYPLTSRSGRASDRRSSGVASAPAGGVESSAAPIGRRCRPRCVAPQPIMIVMSQNMGCTRTGMPNIRQRKSYGVSLGSRKNTPDPPGSYDCQQPVTPSAECPESPVRETPVPAVPARQCLPAWRAARGAGRRCFRSTGARPGR